MFPGGDAGDDADALTPVRKAGVSFYHHASGTVRTGPRSDPQAVVDATGAVRGVAGLSVADASIMPAPPSSPTTLTTMAIAEKIARDFAHAALRRSRRRASGRHRCCLIRTAEPSFGPAQSHRPIERVIT